MAAAPLKERASRFCKAQGWRSARPLPPSALEWSDHECELYFRTFGQFNPRRVREEYGSRRTQPLKPVGFLDIVLESGKDCDDEPPKHQEQVKGRVSVVCPTTEARRNFHESLWESFVEQTWPDKELIIVETYHTRPSSFLHELAKEDPRVTYLAYKRRLPNGKQAEAADRRALLGGRNEHFDFSVGLKRNLGIFVASGEFVAHFDDDDLYSANYLTATVKRLKTAKASVLKLSTWYLMELSDGAISQCDPLSQGILPGYRRSANQSEKEERLYGCGFSYVYRREVALSFPFADMNAGEDYDFLRRILDERGKAAVALMRDTEGLCLHVQHGKNLAACTPARDVQWEEVGRLHFKSCPGFKRYFEIFHIAAAMPEFVETRFKDVDAAVQEDLEAALLNDWSENCALGIATGRESKKTLEALLREVKAGVSKDELRRETTEFMEKKYPAGALVEPAGDAEKAAAAAAERGPQSNTLADVLGAAMRSHADEFGAS